MILASYIIKLGEIAVVEKRVFLSVRKRLILNNKFSRYKQDRIFELIVQRSHIEVLAFVTRGENLQRLKDR